MSRSTHRLYLATAFALAPLLGFPWVVRAADNTPPQQTQTPQNLTPPQSPQGTAHQGVLAPPSTGDAAINRGTPAGQHFPTPVIRPSPAVKPQTANPQKE
jgi:hypothetical protein